MGSLGKCSFLLLIFALLNSLAVATTPGHYRFVVRRAYYRRLCTGKKILTVNGEFPGPTIYARKGDTIWVNVINRSNSNITIHWHGVKQPRNPWHDGPGYITQCPIMPGTNFVYKLIFSKEEGTVWWHAHIDWQRATVHGAIVVYPKEGTEYPFPKPHAEIPIIISEWWNAPIEEVLRFLVETGAPPNISDAYTINGQPGDLYPCSARGTFKAVIEYGKTYLLRLVNAAMNEIHFLSIADHPLTVVGVDGSYTKPFTNDYLVIGPGQTIDALLYANQDPGQRYYLAARAYNSNPIIGFDNTTTTAIFQYANGPPSNESTPLFPYLPPYNDTQAVLYFENSLRSLATYDHPTNVPISISADLTSTISINTFPCEANNTCLGPNGTRLAAAMNNISFVPPWIDILEAYYYKIAGQYTTDFPLYPPFVFNYTAPDLPVEWQTPERGTRVIVLRYNSTVEMVLQNTVLAAELDHPMHLHGYSFYVVGRGLGNYNPARDPLMFNLRDPVLRNTATVPIGGWVAIRFIADNPGVWFMHCHLERHMTWGMDTVFIVLNGGTPETSILPPPPYMPPCIASNATS